jgi:pSer/pThr/pTyr-binding forkhead associated (FHA) protein
MKIRLVSYDDWAPRRKITLDKLPAVIGRSSDADFQLDDRWVSRVHCEISEIDGTLVVRDLESMNGTLVNGNSVTDSLLLPGDTLTVGMTRFEVYYERHKSKPTSGSRPKAASRLLQGLGIRFPLLPVPRAKRLPIA